MYIVQWIQTIWTYNSRQALSNLIWKKTAQLTADEQLQKQYTELCKLNSEQSQVPDTNFHFSKTFYSVPM